MRRILLVGGDGTLGAVGAALRARGYRVFRAKAVDQTLWGGDGHLDGVLLELNMPSIDGVDALARLRAVEGLQETPVAVITGDHLMEEDMRGHFEALGASIHLKPVWVEELMVIAQGLAARLVADGD